MDAGQRLVHNSAELKGDRRMEEARNVLAFLFDLDGTLVDSVYQHVLT